MIVGLGLDVTELDRLQTVLDRYGERFLRRILTPAERAALPVYRLPRLAGLFAAKEAAVKALGTGFSQGIGFFPPGNSLRPPGPPRPDPVRTGPGPGRRPRRHRLARQHHPWPYHRRSGGRYGRGREGRGLRRPGA